MRQFLRSRWIVDRGLQFNLVTRMVIFVLFTFAVLSAMLFAPLVRDVEKSEGPVPREAVDTLLFMQERMWPAAILCLLVAVAGAVFVSHRIAGPLVRVKRILRFLTEGHFPQPLATRPRDYFKDEVDVLNRMVASESARIAELKRAAGDVQDAIAHCAGCVDEGLDPELRTAFAQVVQRADEMEALLEQFSWHDEPEPEELPGGALRPVPEPELGGAL